MPDDYRGYLEDLATALAEAGLSERAEQVRADIANLGQGDRTPCGLCGQKAIGYRFALRDGRHPVRLCWWGPDVKDCYHRWHEGERPTLKLSTRRGGSILHTALPAAVSEYLAARPGDLLTVDYDGDGKLSLTRVEPGDVMATTPERQTPPDQVQHVVSEEGGGDAGASEPATEAGEGGEGHPTEDSAGSSLGGPGWASLPA